MLKAIVFSFILLVTHAADTTVLWVKGLPSGHVEVAWDYDSDKKPDARAIYKVYWQDWTLVDDKTLQAEASKYGLAIIAMAFANTTARYIYLVEPEPVWQCELRECRRDLKEVWFSVPPQYAG